METEKTLNSQSSVDKEDGAAGIIVADLRLHHKAAVLKQNGTGTKTEIQTTGTRQRAQK